MTRIQIVRVFPQHGTFKLHVIRIVLPFILAGLMLVLVQAGLNHASNQSSALAAGKPGASFQAGDPVQDEAALSYGYIPLVTKDYEYFPKLSVGSVSASSYMTCTTTSPPNELCTNLSVTCPQTNPIQADLRVTEPTTATLKGTIIFFTGWTGGYWWGVSWEPNNITILGHLRAAGFRTVEVKWPGAVSTSWHAAHYYSGAGMSKVGCRPASVIQWVYDNLHTDKALPYCATGHSNGGSQLALSLVYYGMERVLDATVFESGPNFTRIDQGCLCDDPAYSNICWPNAGDRELIDYSYGERWGTRPCYLRDVNYRTSFLFDSLVNEFWRFKYPNTTVAFVFGQNDGSQTRLNAKLYFQKLMSLAPTNVISTTVAGSPHFVTETAQGAQVMEDMLKNTCIKP